MALGNLRILDRPNLKDSRLVIGLDGWMDGGEVSTGTIEWLIREYDARKLAEIDSEGFYIYNLPGSMDIATLFRPHTRIKDGIVTEFEMPGTTFHYSVPHRLILMEGKEPNLAWEAWTERVFSLATTFDVTRIYFVGSVAGTVPHTRDPRLFASVSLPALKEELAPYGIHFSNYTGPASIVTLLLRQAAERKLRMISLVAEIPGYIEGMNPRSIETVTRKLAGMLELPVSLTDLREVADEFEEKLHEEVEKSAKLKKLIGKLEKDYDNEVFDTQMGDLKDWLEERGLRLD